MLVAFFRFVCLAIAYLPYSANGQCIPQPASPKQEVFSSVKDLRAQGVNVGPAGIELSLEERGDRVIATFRDYAGSANPIETTKLQGSLEGSGSVCKISLFGRNRHGKMEIRGTIGIADFHGTVIRQVGKGIFSQKVVLKRKLPETDVRIGMLSDTVTPTDTSTFLPEPADRCRKIGF